jgi:HEPN domain-containing protein
MANFGLSRMLTKGENSCIFKAQPVIVASLLYLIKRSSAMDIHERVKYWLDIASYDLKTAQAMFKTKRFLYVGFMRHQVIEKSLKAYYWSTKQQEPEYIHHLIRLCELSGLNEILSEKQSQLIETLMPLNIQARYPKDKKFLLKILTL